MTSHPAAYVPRTAIACAAGALLATGKGSSRIDIGDLPADARIRIRGQPWASQTQTRPFLKLTVPPRRPANTIAGLPHGTIYTLRPRGKRVILLNDGEPVNFSHLAPPEPAVFDLVMATILAGSIELALGRYAGRTGFLDVFDSIVERHQLDELFLALHTDSEILR